MLPSTDRPVCADHPVSGDRPVSVPAAARWLVRSRRAPLALSVLAAATALLLGSCGSSAETATSSSSSAGSAAPVTVQNCGATVTFDAAPERVVLLKSASVPYLADLGVLDKVVARAGVYPRAYYDDATWAALEKIPLLTDKVDSSGHLQISREEVLAQKPDLVLGQTDNLNREALAASDIPLLEEPALCNATGGSNPDWSTIDSQMTMYGKVFHQEEAATKANAEIDAQLASVRATVPAGEQRSVAVLYPTVGGGVTYAYGTQSMASPQVKAAGLKDVFGDVDQRVFEVTREELIGRNPDVLVLLYSDGDPAAVTSAITSMTGADQITAVKNDAIVTMLFNFTEPPSPLSVDGLEMLVKELHSS